MIRATLILSASLIVAGCSDEMRTDPDQCLRVELFRECMRSVPAGPVSTKYNDWSEVVSECGSQSYYQSRRNRALIAEECRP